MSDQSGPENSPRYPTPFGRGWIPASRDIGLPGEQRCGQGGDTPLPLAGGVGGGPVGDPDTGFCGEAGDMPSPDPSLLRQAQDEREGDWPHTGWTDARKVAFLHYLAEKGDVRAAAARVGMSRQSAYLLRRRDRVFAQGWGAALVLARSHVEEVLATRALDGVEEAVFYHGEQVAVRRRYDNRLLLAHLARLDRMAGETLVGEQASRFDEVLALLSGEAPADDFFRAGIVRTKPDPVLPLAREEYAHFAAGLADGEAWENWRAAFEEGEATQEDEPEPDYEGQVAHAAGEWDAWEGRAFARVDELVESAEASPPRDEDEPPMEFKSLAGPAFSPLEPCKPCKPRAPMENIARGRERNGGPAVIASEGRRGTSPPPSHCRAGRLFVSATPRSVQHE